MDKEQKLLIDLVNGAIKKQKVEYSSEEIDAKKLLSTAKMHSVLNTIYPVLNESEKRIAANVYAAFINQYALLDYYSGKIFERFEESGICYMPLKGAVLRKLYPDPLLRSSCDVDIFYKKQDTDKVNEILADIGFDYISDGENHMFHQLNKTVTVEMHHDLLENDKKRSAYYDGIWDRLHKTSDYGYSFSDEDFYVFMLLHMYKHLNHGGFGIRSVLDVYVYNDKKNLNKEYLNCEFDKLKIAKFVSAIENLANFWFNNAPCDELTSDLADFIFSSGVYGTVQNSTLTALSKTNKVKYFFSRLFLPFSNMKRIYPSLNKCVLHLPFLYVHRLVKAVFDKKQKVKAKSELKTLVSSNSDKSEEISELFKKLQIND